MNLFGCFFKHQGKIETKTRWIEITAKKNPPNQVVLEILQYCTACGKKVRKSYPTKERVTEHFKAKIKADGDRSRCWCICKVTPQRNWVCNCHKKENK